MDERKQMRVLLHAPTPGALDRARGNAPDPGRAAPAALARQQIEGCRHGRA